MISPVVDVLELAIDLPRHGMYPVRVTTAAGEQARSTLILPQTDRVFDMLLAQIIYRNNMIPIHEDQIITFGQQLHHILLHGPTAALLQSATTQAIIAKRSLQIRLVLEADDALLPVAELPWEFLADDAGFPLVFHHSLVRTLPRTTPLPPITVEGPLRMLLAWALPPELTTEYPLDIKAEVDAIQEQLNSSIDQGQLTIQELPHVTTLALQRAVRDQRPHIVHLVAHGLGYPDAQPSLLLEDASGDSAPLSPRQLAILFHDCDVRLVVLNACHSGAQGARIFRSFGLALLNAQIPAVVGMQSSVQEKSGRVFATELYRTLAFTGSIDQAVQEGRKAIIGSALSNVDWGLATLYLRAQDGQLFYPPSNAMPPSHDPAEVTQPLPSPISILISGTRNVYVGRDTIGSISTGDQIVPPRSHDPGSSSPLIDPLQALLALSIHPSASGIAGSSMLSGGSSQARPDVPIQAPPEGSPDQRRIIHTLIVQLEEALQCAPSVSHALIEAISLSAQALNTCVLAPDPDVVLVKRQTAMFKHIAAQLAGVEPHAKHLADQLATAALTLIQT